MVLCKIILTFDSVASLSNASVVHNDKKYGFLTPQLKAVQQRFIVTLCFSVSLENKISDLFSVFKFR